MRVGARSLLAGNLQLRPPALSNCQLIPLGSAGGMPWHRDVVYACGGSENQRGGPGGPCAGTGVSSCQKNFSALSECSTLSGCVPRLILPEASLCGSFARSLACWHQGGPRAPAIMQGAGANCALTMSSRPSQGPVRFGLGRPWMRGIPFGSLSNKPASSDGGTWQEPRRCRRDRRRKNSSDTQEIR